MLGQGQEEDGEPSSEVEEGLEGDRLGVPQRWGCTAKGWSRLR